RAAAAADDPDRPRRELRVHAARRDAAERDRVRQRLPDGSADGEGRHLAQPRRDRRDHRHAVSADDARLRSVAAVVIVVMGVSGSGKTTVGQALAAAVGAEFRDADDYHPRENVEKMARGIPLTDEDRAPWLDVLRELIDE